MKELVAAGMDIARMNFSHCTYAEYKARAKRLKRMRTPHGEPIRIMQDLQGPRIRVGSLPADGILLHEGSTYTFCDENRIKRSNKNCIPIDDPFLHIDIKKGEPLHLANGDLELVVTSVKHTIITARVLRGGVLFSHKAINVPDTELRRSGLTKKDIKDALFAVRQGVDTIALSFVQSADDVLKLRHTIKASKGTKIIAKIERGQALKKIDEIIQASDGIMIARGDLGIEIPVEEIPIIQKNLVRHAHWHNKPVIIATQMLTSMIRSPKPTRAEVSDIANAVFDGADAVLLSDETAAGEHPVNAVSIMRKIINRTERYLHSENPLFFD